MIQWAQATSCHVYGYLTRYIINRCGLCGRFKGMPVHSPPQPPLSPTLGWSKIQYSLDITCPLSFRIWFIDRQQGVDLCLFNSSHTLWMLVQSRETYLRCLKRFVWLLHNPQLLYHVIRREMKIWASACESQMLGDESVSREPTLRLYRIAGIAVPYRRRSSCLFKFTLWVHSVCGCI